MAYTDGASSRSGSGTGVVLRGPLGFSLSYALHFQFEASNNVTKYEIVVKVLQLARSIGVRRLIVFTVGSSSSKRRVRGPRSVSV